MLSKRKIVTAVTVVSLVLPSVTVLPAYAASGPTGEGNFFSGLVTFIAQKFGLDKTQVQSVLNDYKGQQKQTMVQNMLDREKSHLDQLVKDGKITGDQETAIINEQAALKQKYNPANVKNETPDQRKTDFENMQNDISTWAKSQGIDPKYVMPGFGMRPMGRRSGMGGWKNHATPTPTPTQ